MLRRVPDPDREVDSVRAMLLTRRGDIDFESEPALASRIAALGLWKEIGTLNDQLSQRLVDADTGVPVSADSARADVIEYNDHVGVQICYEHHERLATTSPSLQSLFHPSLSFNTDGTIRQVVIFPLSVARIARREGARLVIVPGWALDMPFASSELGTAEYYRDFARPDSWAGVRQWIVDFCRLTEQQKIPFFTTHDLVSHITGFRNAAWGTLIEVAHRIRACLDRVFAACPAPAIQTLVLPFMAGYLLDGLAQPAHGDSERIVVVIDLVLEAIESPAVRAQAAGILRRFPRCYWKVLEHMRSAPSPLPPSFRDDIRRLIDDVVLDMRQSLEVSPARPTATDPTTPPAASPE